MDPLTIALVLGGTAAMNTMQNSAQKKKDAAALKAQAEKEQWSPWSGLRPSEYSPKSTGAGSAFLQGGLAGLKTAASMGAFGKDAPTTDYEFQPDFEYSPNFRESYGATNVETNPYADLSEIYGWRK